MLNKVFHFAGTGHMSSERAGKNTKIAGKLRFSMSTVRSCKVVKGPRRGFVFKSVALGTTQTKDQNVRECNSEFNHMFWLETASI